MGKGYAKIEEMSTADLGFSLEEVRGRSLDAVARMGAKLVLEVAMAEEVAEFLGRNRLRPRRSGSARLPQRQA